MIADLKVVTLSGRMVMEMASIALDALYFRRSFDWVSKLKLLREVFEALLFLHTMYPSVGHVDIDSANVLVFGDSSDLSTCTAQITGFGCLR